MTKTKDVVLEELLGGYEEGRAVAWLRSRFPKGFVTDCGDLALGANQNEQNHFVSIRQLGYVKDFKASSNAAEGKPVYIAAIRVKHILGERTSRVVQFNCAKRLLNEALQSTVDAGGLFTQGLFFFYDDVGNFRLSLLSGEVRKRSLVLNDAKRQTFHVTITKENNIFRRRLASPFSTFEQLQEAFSVEALTKEFYDHLFAWFVWSTNPKTGITFPNDDATDKDDQDKLAEAMIRLVTRLMFIWFLKEKGLVPSFLFKLDDVKCHLKSFEPLSKTKHNYYRAILQNLFFATLNTKPEVRGFVNPEGLSTSYMVKTKYRYQEELNDPQAFANALKDVPFLNCSLFDCLDTEKKERLPNGERSYCLYDGFSQCKKRQAHLPNILFFGNETDELGLITILSQYEFTIDENLHRDADVALDPELLGKVFENLLGAYNPETKETARKSTGSFYTPRHIVDMMVRESLQRILVQKVPTLSQKELDDLFDSAKVEEPARMSNEHVHRVQDVLYSCRILDPACGSGAFPMGILHIMVQLLQRLDPNNTELKIRLRKRYDSDRAVLDQGRTEDEILERKAELEEQLKESNANPDYARKLYLIENCIYGSDIQPIAVQIAKLRFFISLLCDQFHTQGAGKLLSLPNLETKFVCANSLIPLPNTEDQLSLISSEKVTELRKELQETRHRLYSARTTATKKKYREKDGDIRQRIRDAIKQTACETDEIKIATWQAEIARLEEVRVTVAEPDWQDVETSDKFLFDEMNEPTLSLRVDVNAEKRAEIDANLVRLQCAIEKERARATMPLPMEVDLLATLVAEWDPYNQNASAEFFDPDWMFGVKAFDIVIGNPPYISTKGVTPAKAKRYEGIYGFSDDTYNLFTFRAIRDGVSLLAEGGVLSYIIPKTFWTIQTKQNMRDLLLAKTFRFLFDTANPFASVMVDTCVICVENTHSDGSNTVRILDGSRDLNAPTILPELPQSTFLQAPRKVLFKPTPLALGLYQRFGEKVKELLKSKWDWIATSKKIEQSKPLLRKYVSDLTPGEVTLLGCVTEGGQGLATGDNGRYVAVRSDSKWARNVRENRAKKLKEKWKAGKVTARDLDGLDPDTFLATKSEADIALTFDKLKKKYKDPRFFGKGLIYRLAVPEQIADADALTQKERENGIADDALATYVLYDKGDKDGNRWYLETPYVIQWTKTNVSFLKKDPKARYQGYTYYFKEGFCWTDVNSTFLKSRIKKRGVFDVLSMSLFTTTTMPDWYYVCLINTSLISLYVDIFINNTSHFQINDARQLPIVVPTEEQLAEAKSIFDRSVAIKRAQFASEMSEAEADEALAPIQVELDRWAYRLYGFTEEEVAAFMGEGSSQVSREVPSQASEVPVKVKPGRTYEVEEDLE